MVGAVDAAYRENTVYAAAVVCDYPSMRLVEHAQAIIPVGFPYVPGLLSFREVPAILDALSKLCSLPDLMLVDGHGLAHPRRFGLACHLGVLLDTPVVGVAKSVLVGEMGALGTEPGSIANLVEQGEVVGVSLRTRRNTRPVYLSIGNNVDLATCVRVVLRCTRDHRLPEPSRLAHQFAGMAARSVVLV
jgi:deoxyribonuclease V